MTITIEGELALIKRKGQPAPPPAPAIAAPEAATAPALPDPSSPAEAAALADLSDTFQAAIKPVPDTGPDTALPPGEEEPPWEPTEPVPVGDAGFVDIWAAAWKRDTITTDAWGYADGKRRDLVMDMYRTLPPEAQARATASQRNYTSDWRTFEQMVMDEAGKFVATDPTKWGDLPLTQDQFDQRLKSEDQAILADAEAVLAQPGGDLTEFFASMTRSLTKPESLALLPFGGAAGGAGKFILSEMLLSGFASVAALPGQYDAADRLDLPDPDATTQVATEMAFGGLFAGGILGIAKGFNWATGRERTVVEALPEGESPVQFGAAVDRAEAELTGQRTVQEATKAPEFDLAPFTIKGATREDAISGLTPEFRGAMGQMISAAPPEIQQGLRLMSAYRSVERQEQLWAEALAKYGSAAEARKWVAPPGKSQHNHGQAIDLEYASPEVKAWAHANAARFGLHFPLSNEPWHIEPIGARGGKGASGPAITLPPGTVPYNEAAVLRGIVGSESGGNITARNPNSSAAGLGQIISGTWLDLVKKHRPDLMEGRSANEILALRDDGQINAYMTAMYARDNHAALTGAGLPAGPGELYLAHFMGTTGATRALRAPLDTPISRLMTPKEITANAGVRFGGKSFADFTAGDLRRWAARKMRAAYDPNASADMPGFADGGTSRGYTGSGQVAAGDGTRVDVDYEVVDYASLIRAAGDLQPRDRSRINSDAWIADTAAQLDPARLMPSPSAALGAPIIGPDNIIESGNGRVAAIGRAYERVPDRAEAYRAAIEAAGYTIPEGVTQPVLIARRTSQMDAVARKRFVIEAQDSGVAQMTPTEMARATASNLASPILARLDPTQPVASAANGDFVRAALATLPRSARNAMFDANGALNANGQRQLREALFARAWPDPDILARYTEGGSPELKSLLDALETAAPNWAALRADIEAGLVSPDMDISPFVLDAMRLIGNARDLSAKQGLSAGRALTELLDQVDMLDGAISPLTVALVRKFWSNGRAAPAEQVAIFLARYADEARTAGKSGGMFDAPTPRDVLRTVDPVGFAELPEDLGRARGFATPTAPQAAMGDEAFTDGAQSTEVEAVHAEIRSGIERQAEDDSLTNLVASGASFEDIAAHPKVAAAFAEMAARPPTTLLPDYGTETFWASREYRAGDQVLIGRDAATDHLYDAARRMAWEDEGLTMPEDAVRAERKATILLGPPAAGKSTVANPLARKMGAAIIDADEAKKLMPEYDGGIGANAVHEESTEVISDVLDRAMVAGDNMVLPKVGSNLASMDALAQRLRSEGYTVNIVLVDVPEQVAMQRMIGRFIATGRIIPLDVLKTGVDGAKSTYDMLKARSFTNAYAHIDNSPGLDQPRRIVEDPGQILHADPGGMVPGRGGRGSAGPLDRAPEGPRGSQGQISGLTPIYDIKDVQKSFEVLEIHTPSEQGLSVPSLTRMQRLRATQAIKISETDWALVRAKGDDGSAFDGAGLLAPVRQTSPDQDPGLTAASDPILDQAAVDAFDAQRAIAAARAGGGAFKMKMPDGTTYDAAEVLDDIAADADTDFQITFCTTNSGASE